MAEKNDSTLSRLEEAVSASGDEQETEEFVANEDEFLLVRIGDDLFAVPVCELAEVLAATDVTAVPHLPPHIPGVVALHGNITAVLDLAVFCGKESEARPRRLLVLHHGELSAAVPVSEVLGIHSIPTTDVEPALPHIKEKQRFVSGQITHDSSVFSVIDTSTLLAESRKTAGSGRRN